MSVGVLLATYNGEKYISELLESLIRQSYSEFVCYIHDDGSTDSTVKICRDYEKRYPSRIVLLDYPKTGGAKTNFFSLLQNVTCDYYFLCDQDDVWRENKIEIMMDAMSSLKQEKSGILAFSDLQVVNQDLQCVEESFYELTHMDPKDIDYKNVLVKGYIPGCAMAFDRVLRDRVIKVDNVCNIKMHDWWIAAISYLSNSKVVFVDKTLVLYRQHSNNTIGAKNFSTIDRIIANLKRVRSGELRRIKKNNLESPRKQALELSKLECLDLERIRFLNEFASLGDRNKIYRIIFYCKNFRHVYRKLWMVLWA